jgi:nicotinate-nucleotide pyrophosphorylase (carboxylating)
MRTRFQEFLKEDIRSGDITSELVIPEDEKARAKIVCKERCVVAGVSEAAEVFRELGARVTSHVKDGKHAERGETVLEVEGRARDLLAGERLALNLIMRMSGIATLTDLLVHRCQRVNPKVRIAATRKTTPGFREFEKKAVKLGGGDPHRYGLDDAILIKDNHITIAGGIKEALVRAKRGSFTKKIEIEVQNPEEAKLAAENGADIVMLDNFSPEMAKSTAESLRKMRPDILIEVSGGITPDNAEKYAASADIISLGSLTHSYRSIDFSMDIMKA